MAHARFVQIVSSSSEITMVVQYIDEYLRANPAPPRNPQAATAVSAALNSTNNKNRGGPIQALTNITSR